MEHRDTQEFSVEEPHPHTHEGVDAEVPLWGARHGQLDS